MFRTMFAAALLASAPVAAVAAPYADLFVFGDSFVDGGALQALSLAQGRPDPTPAAAGYWNGRFSNGFNYADQLSDHLYGAPTVDAFEGGRNYAFGGARSYFIPGDPLSAIPNFEAQLGLYLALAANPRIGADSLVLVSFNTNDLNAILGGTPGAPTFKQAVDAQIAALQQLNALGARNLLVANAADLGIAPVSNGSEAVATAVAAAYNVVFEAALAEAAFLPGTEIKVFDLFDVSQRILADLPAYGLPADLITEVSCQSAPANLPGCVGYGFLDFIHPTTAVQQVIGDFAFQTVPAPAGLALFGLGLIGLMRRRA